MHRRSHGKTGLVTALFIFAILLVPAVSAFTADSLDITVSSNGDATAVFRFTLEGIVENAIPQSILEEQLAKGLSTSAGAPTLVSMDRSSATLIMKGFASVQSVPTGTQYQTASMDFTKASVALQNSGLSSVITADFAPATITVTFPDRFIRSFGKTSSLPALTHIVIDPSKAGSPGSAPATGAINVTSSPPGGDVSVDGSIVGTTPGLFPDIAPGSHIVSVKKAGFDPADKTITVRAGETVPVLLFLDYAAPAPAPASSGFVPVLLIGIIVILGAVAFAVYYTRRKPVKTGEEEQH